MSTAYYTIRQHTIPVSRVGDQSSLSLAVKQYTPKTRNGRDGLTLIAAHANACPKELYEPLWDRLHEAAAREGITIGQIWMADVARQGESGVLNEDKASDEDFSLTDHSRDLLTLINYFKDDMRQPIIGLGHSMGGIDIAHLSLMHPDLFKGIILVDPMLQKGQSVKATLTVVKATAARKDRWPNREEASRYLRRSTVYRTWDTKVFEMFMNHGLRAVGGGEVTLTTPKSQEVLAMVRPGFIDADGNPNAALLRPEPRVIFDMLKHVRPNVLFIVGGKSHLWQDPAGKVASIGFESPGKAILTVLDELGHYAPMEDPRKTADTIARWIASDRAPSGTSVKL